MASFFFLARAGRGSLLIAVHPVTAVSFTGLCHCRRLNGIANKPIAALTEAGARPFQGDYSFTRCGVIVIFTQIKKKKSVTWRDMKYR